MRQIAKEDMVIPFAVNPGFEDGIGDYVFLPGLVRYDVVFSNNAKGIY